MKSSFRVLRSSMDRIPARAVHDSMVGSRSRHFQIAPSGPRESRIEHRRPWYMANSRRKLAHASRRDPARATESRLLLNQRLPRARIGPVLRVWDACTAGDCAEASRVPSCMHPSATFHRSVHRRRHSYKPSELAGQSQRRSLGSTCALHSTRGPSEQYKKIDLHCINNIES